MKLALFGLMALTASGVKLQDDKDSLIPQVEDITSEILAQGELDTEAQPAPAAPARVFSPEEIEQQKK